MMTAVLPLISPEKGTQLGFIAQGLLLVISGVYYPVSVLPQWMQWLSVVSPATYTLEGARKAVLDGAGVMGLWGDIWPLLLIGVIAIPAGLAVFAQGERYAKRHGRLKRSG
jgi:ABC-2 type transport system permease protein